MSKYTYVELELFFKVFFIVINQLKLNHEYNNIKIYFMRINSRTHTSCAYVGLPFSTYDRGRPILYTWPASPTRRASAISVNHVTAFVLPAPSLPLKERGQLAPVPVPCSAPCSDSPPLEPGVWLSHGFAAQVESSLIISTFWGSAVLFLGDFRKASSNNVSHSYLASPLRVYVKASMRVTLTCSLPSALRVTLN